MTEDIDSLLSSYVTKGIFIDSNLLLLLVVGLVSPALVPKFKRTRTFTTKDHALLLHLVGQFAQVVTTPNVLTEVSNLANSLDAGNREKFGQSFARAAQELAEHYIVSKSAVRSEMHDRFGLTDTAIVELCGKGFLLLTDDFPLAGYAGSKGLDVINFNHIRDIADST